MTFILSEHAAELAALEDQYKAEDPARHRPPAAAFVEAVRSENWERASKWLLNSPVFHGFVRDGKLVVTSRGRPLGHVEVPGDTWPGKFGARGWARAAGKILSNAASTALVVPMHDERNSTD